MRVLINTWSWPTHYYQMAPLAWALRAAGHDVLAAVPPAQASVVEGSGVPVHPTGTDLDALDTIRRIASGVQPAPDRPAWQRQVPRSTLLWLTLAESQLDDLIALARRWRPDVVLFDPSSWAAPLAARVIGAPAVRHPWGADIMAAMQRAKGVLEAEIEAMGTLCERYGVDGVDTLGDLTVDPCPRGMQAPGLTHRRTEVRYLPYHGTRRAPLDADVLDVPDSTVCVTWGTTIARLDPAKVLLARAVEAVAGAGLPVLVAVDDDQRALLGPVPAGVQVVTSAPLHAVLPRCAAVLGHGGAGTILTGLVHGLPQVSVPLLPDHRFNATRLAHSGAGIAVPHEEASPDTLRNAVLTVVGEVGYRKAAHELAADIAARPLPADVVPRLVELAGR